MDPLHIEDDLSIDHCLYSLPEMMECAVIYMNKIGNIFFLCSICHGPIQKVECLGSHIQDHFKNVPLTCHICCETVNSLDSLVQHINLHSCVASTSIKSFVPATDNSNDIIKLEMEDEVNTVSKSEEPHTNTSVITNAPTQCLTSTSEKQSILQNCIKDEKVKNEEQAYSKNHETELTSVIKNEADIIVGSVKRRRGRPKKLSKIIRRDNLEIETESNIKYTCEFCGKISNTKTIHYDHKRIHRGPFKCEACDKLFTTKSSLKVHSLIHTGEKPMQCYICGKNFRTANALRGHMHSHIDVPKRFKCDNCDKRFHTKYKLQVHIRSHTDERPFACGECHSRFRRADALREHSKLHSGKKEYVCKICNKAFAQIPGLHCHMKNHRNSSV